MAKKIKGSDSTRRISGVYLPDRMTGNSGSSKRSGSDSIMRNTFNNDRMTGNSGSRKRSGSDSIPRSSTKQKLQRAFSQSVKKGR